MSIKTVLITGGAGGIGREFSKLFAADGYQIIAVDLHEDALVTLGEELKSDHPDLIFHPISMDLSTQEAAKNLFDLCDEKDLSVDVLINNVGFGLMGEHTDIETSRIENMLMVNNLLLTNLCQFFGKRMKAQRSGSILNVASLVGLSPAPFFSAYSGTKAYTIAFSVGLARELGEYGVNVSCLCPGTTKTAFLDTAQTGSQSASSFTKFVSAYMITPDIVANAGFEGLKRRKLLIVPTTFLFIQALFLRHLPMRFVSWFVHKKSK